MKTFPQCVEIFIFLYCVHSNLINLHKSIVVNNFIPGDNCSSSSKYLVAVFCHFSNHILNYLCKKNHIYPNKHVL